jgi:acetyl esterase
VHQVLFSPVTDVRDNFTTRSELEFFENFFITTPSLPIGLERAFGTNQRTRLSILASPILMSKKEAARQPPTLVVVSSADVLRSEGEAFAKVLLDGGVECALIRAEGQVHDSALFEATRRSPTAKAILTLAAAQLREALGAETVERVQHMLTQGKSGPRNKRKREEETNGDCEPKQARRKRRRN